MDENNSLESDSVEKEETSAVSDKNESSEKITEDESSKEVIEDGSSEEKTGDENKEKKKDFSGVQKRINQLTAEKYRALREAEELRNRLSKEEKDVSSPVEIPTLEQFDYDDSKYTEALIDYKVRQQVEKVQNLFSQQEEIRRREQSNREFAKKIQKANIPDYVESAEALASSVSLPAELIDAIQENENGPLIVHYLGNHLDEADRIVSLSPVKAAVELGKLSVTLKSAKKKEMSKAPDPPERLSGGGGKSEKKIENMSMEEIYALE